MTLAHVLQRAGNIIGALLRRGADLYVGVVALGVGGLFLFSGGRGCIGYARGIRAAWTEPWVCILGLVGGTAMVLVSIRLFRGPGPHRAVLLSQVELGVLSVGTVAGAAWTTAFAPTKQSLAFLAVGLAGLGLWGVRYRGRRAALHGPAA